MFKNDELVAELIEAELDGRLRRQPHCDGGQFFILLSVEGPEFRDKHPMVFVETRLRGERRIQEYALKRLRHRKQYPLLR